MSPQHSNRQALIEGTLHCIEERPSATITVRDIAAASGANPASIVYHFGSKDALLAVATQEGFRRWLAELKGNVGDLTGLDLGERLIRAVEALRVGLKRRRGLVNVFFAALARAPQDDELCEVLARSYADSRYGVAALLGLGEDRAAIDAASLVLAAFDGLLIQSLVDEGQWPDAAAVWRGIGRLYERAG
jgi:AcrR family transcriptional regulator